MAHRDHQVSPNKKSPASKTAKRQKTACPASATPPSASRRTPTQSHRRPEGADCGAAPPTAEGAEPAANGAEVPIDIAEEAPLAQVAGAEPNPQQQTTIPIDESLAPPPPPPDDPPSTSGRSMEPMPSRGRSLPAPFRCLSPRSFSRQTHDLFLVLDLEATCTKRRDLFPVEIIEVAALLLDAHSLRELGEFQTFVRPTEHPLLDPFCVELTGIQQEQVDPAPLLGEVLPRLQAWLEGLGALREGVSLLPVTWTDWDLKVCLETECEWRKLPRPPYLRRWCNLKQLYTTKYRRTHNLRKCVEAAGLTWQGRQHSGLDDTRNTAALAVRMVKDGVVLRVTDCFKELPEQAPQSQSQPQLGNGGSQGAGGGGGNGALRQTVLTLTPAASAPAALTAAAGTPAALQQQEEGGAAAGAASVTLAAAAATELPLYDSAGRWLGRCRCGVAAHFRTTKKPGANLGRQFYSCGRWTISDRSRQCDFFAWADQLQLGPGAVGAAAAAAGPAGSGWSGGAAGGGGAASKGARTGTKRRR